MDMHQLEHFLYIARYRSFTKAADHFFLGQPTLSRQMAALEQELNVTLFDRTGRTVDLTSAGEVLYRRGQLLLDHYNRVMEETRLTADGKRGVVSIATLGHFDGLLPELIQSMRETFPDISMKIEKCDLNGAWDAVQHTGMDFGLTLRHGVELTDDIESLSLGYTRFCVLIPLHHPLASKEHITLEDLKGMPLILPEYSYPAFLRPLILDSHGEHVSYTRSMESLLLQVGAGLGISSVPQFASAELRSSDQYVVIRDLEDENAREEIVLFWLRSNPNPAVPSLLSAARRIPLPDHS